MKGFITSSLLIATLAPVAHAGDCTPGGGGTRQNGAALVTIVGNQTVCASAGNGDTWQEYHQQGGSNGGSLTEYARGPGHPVDPTHVVGTWERSGNTLVYTYNTGSSYTFELWLNGGTYYYCQPNAGTGLVATINDRKAGLAACN